MKEQHDLLIDARSKDERLDASTHKRRGGRARGRQRDDVTTNPHIAGALRGLVRIVDGWDHRLEDLQSMNVLTGKVPGVEFVFQTPGQATQHRPVLSLAADFNS